jgi:hypothetical protein
MASSEQGSNSRMQGSNFEFKDAGFAPRVSPALLPLFAFAREGSPGRERKRGAR